MNGNAELLNFVVQNAQMGVDTIQQLLGISQDEAFKTCLQAQHHDYTAMHAKAAELLGTHGLDEKGLSKLDTFKTYWMINLQTLSDKSSAHIAEMMILGSNMGIVDAIKKQRQYCHAESDILALMQRLQHAEESNVEKLKAFL